jgi:hypothetical protein
MKKNIALVFVASFLILAGCCTTPAAKGFKKTFSSFDLPSDHAPQTLPANGGINFQGVPVDDVLKIYQALSGRTVIRGSLPDAKITFRSQTPLNRIQALQMLDTVLAQNGIVMVLSGDNAVKAVPTSMAISESPPNITLPWELLPESSSIMSRTVQVKNLQAIQVVPVLAPFTKLPNSIICIQDHNLLILRDYSSNIRQELQMLERLEQKQMP